MIFIKDLFDLILGIYLKFPCKRSIFSHKATLNTLLGLFFQVPEKVESLMRRSDHVNRGFAYYDIGENHPSSENKKGSVYPTFNSSLAIYSISDL